MEPIGIFIPEEIIQAPIIESKETFSDGSADFVKERMGEISEAIDRKEEETRTRLSSEASRGLDNLDKF